MEDLHRSSQTQHIRIVQCNTVVDIDEEKFLRQRDVDGLIRVPHAEFSSIDHTKSHVGHFNLETTDHKVGKKYELVPIVTPGHYIEGEEEVLPVLDVSQGVKAVCVKAENHLSYEEVNDAYFTYSLPHIQNTEELKAVMITRYSRSLPDVSREEILRRGVAYTLLEFIQT